jgi:hypothetical protein
MPSRAWRISGRIDPARPVERRMNELQRQACLKTLGLTPWVARRPLPGAAPSAVLEWPQPPVQPDAAPVSMPPVDEVAPPVPEPVPEAKPSARTARAKTSATTGLHFTLHAMVTPSLLLVIQQADAAAPEPGREEQRLLAAMLRYLGGQGARPRTFAWPMPGADGDAEQARASLSAFGRRLCSDAGRQRILWMLNERTAGVLLGKRFEPLAWHDYSCLVINSLAEMITEPATAKRSSWQAMVAHGFTA